MIHCAAVASRYTRWEPGPLHARTLHSWELTTTEAREVQRDLAARVSRENALSRPPRLIAAAVFAAQPHWVLAQGPGIMPPDANDGVPRLAGLRNGGWATGAVKWDLALITSAVGLRMGDDGGQQRAAGRGVQGSPVSLPTWSAILVRN